VILAYCSGCGAELGLAPPCTCRACGREFWDNAKPCGGAFVAHAGRLLLVERAHQPWAGHWDVPGGFCDGAEHPEAATLREVREETGLAVHITGLLGMWLDRYDDLSPWTLNIYYHAVTDDPSAASALDETTSVRWFTPAELADADTPLAFPDHMRPAVDLWLASTDPAPDGAGRR
jgi:ADP-ribose pyrophosphatase YjhB (NUDIX family)